MPECFRHFQKYLELETKLKSNIQVAIRAGTATAARKKMREDCSGMSEPAVTIGTESPSVTVNNMFAI